MIVLWRRCIQSSVRTELENQVEQVEWFEQDVDGWWANRRLADCIILGHGQTKDEALHDLEFQVAGFENFMKRNRSESAEPMAPTR